MEVVDEDAIEDSDSELEQAAVIMVSRSNAELSNSQSSGNGINAVSDHEPAEETSKDGKEDTNDKMISDGQEDEEQLVTRDVKGGDVRVGGDVKEQNNNSGDDDIIGGGSSEKVKELGDAGESNK